MSSEPTAPISLRAYARHRGVSAMAVSKAVAAGRLRASVTRDEHGQPKIADVALADQEWDAGTDHSKAPGYVKERAAARAAGAPPAAPPAAERTEPPPEEAGLQLGASLAVASAAEKVWRAKLAELDYRERTGELVDAEEMTAKIADVFTRVRTRLLAIPTRAKQQLPHLTVQDVALVDGLVREALEELALEVASEGAEPPAGEVASA